MIAAKKSWLVIVLGLLGVLITAVFLLLPVERSGEKAEGHGERRRTGGGNHESVRP